MRNRIKKLLFALVALALVSGLGFSGQAHGCTPLFSISITSIKGGGGEAASPYTNPICLSGTASVINFPGQLRQYQVQVDWGDGVGTLDSTVNFVQFGNSFWGTWSSDRVTTTVHVATIPSLRGYTIRTPPELNQVTLKPQYASA